jgi:hypothetical protein
MEPVAIHAREEPRGQERLRGKAKHRQDQCQHHRPHRIGDAQRSEAAKIRATAPAEIPRDSTPPPNFGGMARPARAGVIVTATTKDQSSITTTAIAIEPTKSPAGPGSRIIGAKPSTVVAVEANSGRASL